VRRDARWRTNITEHRATFCSATRSERMEEILIAFAASAAGAIIVFGAFLVLGYF
jgi:hypothetical protein